MSISYSDYNHRSEITVFGLTQLKITKKVSPVSKRDVIRIDWVDRHEKPCALEFFLEVGTELKGSVQASKALRKLIATASE